MSTKVAREWSRSAHQHDLSDQTTDWLHVTPVRFIDIEPTAPLATSPSRRWRQPTLEGRPLVTTTLERAARSKPASTTGWRGHAASC